MQTQTDARLEEIRQLANCTTIKTTREYIGLLRLEYDKPSIEFRHSMVLFWCILIIVGTLLICVVSHLILAPQMTSSQLGGHILAILMFAGLLALTYKQQVVDKTKNYIIRIDSTGIFVADKLFPWDTIQETAIMSTSGQNPSTYFVIALKTASSFEYFDLINFPTSFYGFPTKLSQYIEHFKPTPPPPPNP